MEEGMVNRRSWEEFRNIGLLWAVNSILHLFGWSIVLDMDDGKVIDAYPARVKYRGFDGDSNDSGYYKVTSWLKENVQELLSECDEP